MRNAQLAGRGPLQFSYWLTEDKLLRLKHMPQRSEQFLVERLILALQVQHGNRLRA
jgi:hypothetical protein